MDIRQNPLWLSIPLGSIFRTDIRLSIWTIVVALVLCLNFGWQLGLVLSGLLLGSILVHELAHIMAARQTGGSGHEILLWPLGGLAMATPAPVLFSELWTVLAGPLSNGLICLACLPFAMSTQMVSQCIVLLGLPSVDLAREPVESVIFLLFSVNFKLLVLNLCLPIYPLDCSQLIYAVGKIYWDRHTARIGTLWIGLIAGLVLMFVGAYWQAIEVVLLASILFGFCQYEFVVTQLARPYDDSFMGYDFSQGYTSLEIDDDRESRRPGFFEQWRLDRAEKKRQKELLQKIETERRLDELLEKVHLHGMASLTAEERRFLEKASTRYRSQGKE
jgi:stage IV sporulation protein FB